MKQLWLTAKLDMAESLRARWFLIYTLVFGGIVALLFLFGLTESRVLGFIGPVSYTHLDVYKRQALGWHETKTADRHCLGP